MNLQTPPAATPPAYSDPTEAGEHSVHCEEPEQELSQETKEEPFKAVVLCFLPLVFRESVVVHIFFNVSFMNQVAP